MKNKLLVIALLSCCVIASWGCVKREIQNINSTGKNIICFGDSITFGYGVNKGEDYPAILAKILQVKIINAGVDGDTTREALLRINQDVLAQQPSLVIIEFSGNDFLKNILIDETINNIGKMIDLVQEKGSMVAVADISSGMFFRDYRIRLAKLAQEKKAIFIPGLLNGIITNPSLKSDFFHPNSNGYKVVASRVYKLVVPYLKKNAEINRIRALR